MTIGVLIADDHAVVRAGLRMLIDAEADMRVVGEAGDGREAARKARACRPDVVVLDLSMPGPGSGEVIGLVRRAHPGARVLILTMHDDAGSLSSAMAAGAVGYVVKQVVDVELLAAIRAVHDGRLFVNLTLRRDPAPHVPGNLSGRERDVLRLLAQGHSNQQVAVQLRVSVKTVETYRSRLREKLGLRERAELYRYAVESGILKLNAPTRRKGRR